MQWNNFCYEQIEDGLRITKYVPEEEEDEALIPAWIESLPVVEIGPEAFTENGAFLVKIEVSYMVRRIGDGAFRMCLNLTKLVLHEGLKEIGAGAMFLTPLTEVDLPDSVTVIESPWELGSIRFKVSGKNQHFYSDGYCLYRREEEEERQAPEQGDAASPLTARGGKWRLLVALQEDKRESYDVPEGTTAIGDNAFSGNEYLKQVTFPSTLRMIGEAAFEGCQNLSEIVLNEGLREIGSNAFAHCIRLTSLNLPSTVETIGESSLSDTFGWSELFQGLERITVAPGDDRFMADDDALFETGESNHRFLVKYFGEGEEYRIPWDVSRILPGAFRRANFCRCEIPMSVRSVGHDAFRECKNLEEITLKESGTTLYIPGQPVYRKDEVTALFYEERPAGGYLYDYAGYDELFDTYLNLPDKCGMACCRLKYPVQLTEERARFYREFLDTNLTGILKEVSKKQDMDLLVMLAELGVFNEDNIDESIDILSSSGQTKFTGYLLNYMKEHGGKKGFKGFDFSL